MTQRADDDWFDLALGEGFTRRRTLPNQVGLYRRERDLGRGRAVICWWAFADREPVGYWARRTGPGERPYGHGQVDGDFSAGNHVTFTAWAQRVAELPRTPHQR